jgi:transposase-like protein
MEAMVKRRMWPEQTQGGEEGGAQGARRATGEPPSSPAASSLLTSEVEPKAERRRFSTAYKLQILEEADRCKGPGEIGALLRREGLYFSHLSKWRKLRATGELGAKRGRKADLDAELRRQIQQLERENQRLKGKLRQAEIIIEVQKKASEILGIALAGPEDSNETS